MQRGFFVVWFLRGFGVGIFGGFFVTKDCWVRPFILCKDDDTFCAFGIPNWFKCLN